MHILRKAWLFNILSTFHCSFTICTFETSDSFKPTMQTCCLPSFLMHNFLLFLLGAVLKYFIYRWLQVPFIASFDEILSTHRDCFFQRTGTGFNECIQTLFPPCVGTGFGQWFGLFYALVLVASHCFNAEFSMLVNILVPQVVYLFCFNSWLGLDAFMLVKFHPP